MTDELTRKSTNFPPSRRISFSVGEKRSSSFPSTNPPTCEPVRESDTTANLAGQRGCCFTMEGLLPKHLVYNAGKTCLGTECASPWILNDLPVVAINTTLLLVCKFSRCIHFWGEMFPAWTAVAQMDSVSSSVCFFFWFNRIVWVRAFCSNRCYERTNAVEANLVLFK